MMSVVCIFTKSREKTKAVMKLQNVANFGPEMSSKILKKPSTLQENDPEA